MNNQKKVHIKDKIIPIQCGNGGQRIRWLADVAIQRYDPFYGIDLGPAEGIRFDNGVELINDDIINEHLTDDSHVWVTLKEDTTLVEKDKGKQTLSMQDKKIRKK